MTGTGDLAAALAVSSGIVCLVGAGGKKSTMYRIISGSAARIAVTSTVHTPPFRKRLAADVVIGSDHELLELVGRAEDSRVVAYACPSDKRARLAGVAPELVRAIHETCGFDLTLVKADGARLRHIKAPGEHEPVLPDRFDTLVSLVSVRAVGEPLDRTVAHRPELIAALTGAVPGRPLTTDHIASLLAHPKGGLKHAERAAAVVPVINMVDTPGQRQAARLIADQVLQQASRLDRVVLTSMVSPDPVVEIVSR
ncbi:MAG TPA: selenium cofactor biosynthesis protein YqeC [Arenicellales bacterium]|nr:selenium cofactor biosynthesis protein YqeC [Arenicellales bacterium]